MYGIYRDNDEWVDEFGEGERCPKCGAPDWHQDPWDEDHSVWTCESCGHTVDAETGKEIHYDSTVL